MIVRVEASTIVDRYVDDVFAYITTIESIPRWHQRAMKTWRSAEGPLVFGSVWRAIIRIVGLGTIRQVDFKVTAYEPNRRFHSWTESVRLPFGMGYELATEGNGTRVVCLREMRLEGWQILIRPFVRYALQKEINHEARALEHELESVNAKKG